MYFQPAIPIGGYGGWQLLQKTSARQQEIFEKSPALSRDIEYFLENIEKADTPAKLVGDRRLLTVALGAFGLGEEINKRAFIERVLESDLSDPESFANRLNEPRYKELARTFGYGDPAAGANVILTSFKENIVARFTQTALDRSPALASDLAYFLENAGKANTPKKLVEDERLMSLVLDAFGLNDDYHRRVIANKAMEAPNESLQSFAARLTDPRHKDLAKALGDGLGEATTNLVLDSFKDSVVSRFKEMEFERSVGDVDEDMRLAMNFKREIGKIASGSNADKVGWLQAMGQLPVRTVLFKALGIPDSVARLDIDKQTELLERKAQAMFGTKSIAHLNDPEVVDGLIRRFFLFRQMENGPSALTPGSAALTLLQSSGLSGNSAANLLLSQG